MADKTIMDEEMEDEYDEEADSDFDANSGELNSDESSVDEQGAAEVEPSDRFKKRQKTEKSASKLNIEELDSGDEATIKEQEKIKRRQRRKGEDVEEDPDVESEGWRPKTRSMRERDKEERKINKLVSIQGSTIDVDKMWEEMNKPGFAPSRQNAEQQLDSSQPEKLELHDEGLASNANKENISELADDEKITIKRTYKFAGEVHVEEKTVLRSSAEARLWLAQQASKPKTIDLDGNIAHRPLRKISRFDPNYSNLDAFKGSWTSSAKGQKTSNGPKLNVVEKSKMDWAVHVDTEGLKEELDEHAKAKEGYLGRMDFLGQVEQRKEAEARAARLKGS